jgi:hypothetical protein
MLRSEATGTILAALPVGVALVLATDTEHSQGLCKPYVTLLLPQGRLSQYGTLG